MNLIKRILQVTALLCLLSSCATTETVWDKPNSSQQEFYRDSGQCKAQGFGATGMNMYQVTLIFNSCMQGKGWYLVERPIRR
jgi:hypothetical protein